MSTPTKTKPAAALQSTTRLDSFRNSAIFGGVRSRFQQLLAFATLILIFLFFTLASPYFLSYSNVTGILMSTAVTGLLAIGTTFVIITGGIDLSIGTGMTLTSVVSALVVVNGHQPAIAGVIAAVVFGAFMGGLSGAAVAILKIPPFIATLAMMLIAQGLSLVITHSQPIYFNDPENVPPDVTSAYQSIALGSIIPGTTFPNAPLIFFGMAIVGAIVLNQTIVGRYTFSIGSNEEATALSGINVRKWKIIIYAIGGFYTGIAGVILSSRLTSAQPAVGVGYELEAIAAVVIGGTSLSGGRGSILGTVIGALILAVLTNGLRIMSIPQEWQKVAVGVVILIAVYLDQLRRREG
jgi:ribose transport system permease protein